MAPRIALICVGSELLRGKVNTHASTISQRLSSLGLALSEEMTVSDEQVEIASAIRHALSRFPIVLVSGGLGPTFDDLTREAAAHATSRPLHLSPPLLRSIQKKFKRARYRMPAANARQAYLLEGARAIANRVGTAPGQWLELGSQILVLLPGPPSELHPMLETYVLPRLKKYSRGHHAEAHLYFVGVPESVIDHQVRPIIQNETGVDFTILARPGLVSLDILVHADSRKNASSRLERIARAIQRKTGKTFYGMNDDASLERVVMKKFLAKKSTLAVAESCTGGMLAKCLTDVPGSSSYFLGGVVSYANSVKNSQLDVPLEVLRAHGAVSKEVALAMAKGIRLKFASTWGLSITGIAGPGGGTPRKPVGLVYISISTTNSAICRAFHFRGSRSIIRHRSVYAALDMLRSI